MRLSPVQLLDSRIERLHIEPSRDETAESHSDSQIFAYLMVHRSCSPSPDYWDDTPDIDSGIKERTFHVRLGLKTPDDKEPLFPYRFELLVSGYFAIEREKIGDLEAPDIAVQYGLTILLGTIRETLLSNSARMPKGPFLLPTFTFLGATFGDIASEQASSPPVLTIK